MIWFDEDDLLRRVGGDGFDRALPYLDETGDLEVSSDEVVATVGIDDQFRLRLTGADGQLIGECSCPEGRRGVFCVHCVAAAVMAVDVTTPPDVEALLSQVNALRKPRRLVGPSLLGWAEEANFVLQDLELGTVFYAAARRGQPRKAARVRVNHAGSSSQGKCRNRTRSLVVRATLTKRWASSGSNGRPNTSGWRPTSTTSNGQAWTITSSPSTRHDDNANVP